MASLQRHLPAIFVAILSLISLVFSIIGIVSKEWAIRNNYNTRLNIEDWDKPLYTLYRSPFLICSASFVNASSNATVGTYSSDCERWRPFGSGRTSCESANATGNDTASNLGDLRLCQQIHFAGNFAIASTTFIGLAFLLTLIVTALALLKRDVPKDTAWSSPTGEIRPDSSLSAVAGSYVNYFVLVSFGVGVVTAVIAQFYAILGLTMSLPNNSDFASSAVGSLDDVNTQGSHGPWYQGKALSTYWTCAWAFALAAGVLASRIWALPNWR